MGYAAISPPTSLSHLVALTATASSFQNTVGDNDSHRLSGDVVASWLTGYRDRGGTEDYNHLPSSNTLSKTPSYTTSNTPYLYPYLPSHPLSPIDDIQTTDRPDLVLSSYLHLLCTKIKPPGRSSITVTPSPSPSELLSVPSADMKATDFNDVIDTEQATLRGACKSILPLLLWDDNHDLNDNNHNNNNNDNHNIINNNHGNHHINTNDDHVDLRSLLVVMMAAKDIFKTSLASVDSIYGLTSGTSDASVDTLVDGSFSKRTLSQESLPQAALSHASQSQSSQFHVPIMLTLPSDTCRALWSCLKRQVMKGLESALAFPPPPATATTTTTTTRSSPTITAVDTHQTALYCLAATIDAATALFDFDTAYTLWTMCYPSPSPYANGSPVFGASPSPDAEASPGPGAVSESRSIRSINEGGVLHSYLRAFQSPSHTQRAALQALTDHISYASSSSSTSTSHPHNSFRPSQYYATRGKLLSTRTSDEFINAHLRCCPFPTALRLVHDGYISSNQLLTSTSTSASPQPSPQAFTSTPSSPLQLTITTNAITSLLIQFDRHWRDYDSYDSYDSYDNPGLSAGRPSPGFDADGYSIRDETRGARSSSSTETRARAYEGVSAREGRSLKTEAVMLAQVLATHLTDGRRVYNDYTQ